MQLAPERLSYKTKVWCWWPMQPLKKQRYTPNALLRPWGESRIIFRYRGGKFPGGWIVRNAREGDKRFPTRNAAIMYCDLLT